MIVPHGLTRILRVTRQAVLAYRYEVDIPSLVRILAVGFHATLKSDGGKRCYRLNTPAQQTSEELS